MIREPQNEETMTFTVLAKNGTLYENCDVPPQPFGAYERIVAFYWEGSIRMIPLEDVKYIDMHFEEDEDE